VSTAPRHVIVTGGSRGLGLGIVRAYLAAGEQVTTCARSITPEVEELAADPAWADRFLFLPLDLKDRSASAGFVRAAIDRFGPIRVLVNNAGIAPDGMVGLVADRDVDDVIDLNLKGTIALTRQVVRNMLAHKGQGGWIVNVSSIVGMSGYRGLSVYSATKAALDGFTRALSRELGPIGIVVNSVAPGYLRTELTHGFDPDQLQQIVRRTPAGRLGEPEDVARAVMFLTDPANDYVMGHTLVVDGGITG
jgi:3-oxoacyl-[acyl-carrier protein] reductase